MKKRIVIIRQRPSIGDCLLLGPMIQEVKKRNPDCHLTVVTDETYMGGGLVRIFKGIPGVDRVECIDSKEWTTPLNTLIDPSLRGARLDPKPYTVAKADKVYDCNADFMNYEREYRGDPPTGIAEFWLRHHQLYREGVNLLPTFQIDPEVQAEADAWLAEKNPTNKPIIGIVLRAGESPRDWNFNNKASDVMMSVHTKGFLPLTIDSVSYVYSPFAVNLVGKPIDFVAAVVARCKLVLTPDTGLLHLAQAVLTPQVALWGIMRPELRVAGYDCQVVPEHSLGYCQTHNELKYCQCSWKFQQWSCMRKITLRMIIDGIEKALKKQVVLPIDKPA